VSDQRLFLQSSSRRARFANDVIPRDVQEFLGREEFLYGGGGVGGGGGGEGGGGGGDEKRQTGAKGGVKGRGAM